MNAAPLSDSMFALTFALLLIAPLALAGVALINTGLGRSRSAAQFLLGCVAILAVSAVAFAVLGASLADGPASAVVHVAGRPWNWIGHGPLFLRHLSDASPVAQLGILLEILAVCLTGVVPWGAGADRWRLTAGCATAAVLAIFVFPFAAHWIWGGGWLAALGANFSLGLGFLDGGGAFLHVLGGLSALAVVWIAGPRKGKFPREGFATALPGHNAIYVLFGCLLALVGWMGWNVAGAILFQHAGQSGLVVIALNTLLSASGALLATFAVTRIRFGKPDASLCANGWLAGLVTSSACAGVVNPAAALVTGVVIGIATPLLVEVLELALSIDDPTGAITVHGFGGLWGLFAAGVFAPGRSQLLAQLIGIAALLGFFLPLIYLLLWALNRAIQFRVDPDGERIGMDLQELGGSAYPEFVIHRDETYR